jgi:hypothetical protein
MGFRSGETLGTASVTGNLVGAPTASSGWSTHPAMIRLAPGESLAAAVLRYRGICTLLLNQSVVPDSRALSVRTFR